ncbi:hypothetical protein ACFW1A_15180 [Kitasatospora sp. NPDC058965]|uniref:hypothetical protein n=1 Tax=Kitasatospora sp. NPDC058965 TaxID=3346682 RepID=UPI00367619D8
MTRSTRKPAAHRRVLLAAPVLLLGSLGLAAPAHAAGTLPVSVQCFGDGNSVFDCDAYAPAGVSYSWTPLQNAWITSGAGTSGVFGGCRLNTVFRVSVTVTDSAGNTGTAQGSDFCRQIPQ